MSKPFLILIISLLPFYFIPQNCFKIKIEKANQNVQQDYYFEEVIDARKDSNSIGTVFLEEYENEICADLFHGVKSEFKKFLQNAFTNENALKYLIKVTNLHIEELREANKLETGIAFLEMDFYKYLDTTLVFVTKTSRTVKSEFSDVTFNHSNRLKRVILLSINDFVNFISKDTIISGKNDSLRIVTGQKINPRFPFEKHKKLVNAFTSIAVNSYGCGLKYTSFFKLKIQPNIGIGPSAFFGLMNIFKKPDFPNNVENLNYYIVNLGLSSIFRFKKSWALSFDFTVLFGSENFTRKAYNSVFTGNPNYYYYYNTFQYTITSSTITYVNNAISGFHAEQTFLYFGQDSKGFNAGFGIFERGLDGIFYSEDFGVKLIAGYSF